MIYEIPRQLEWVPTDEGWNNFHMAISNDTDGG